MLVLFWFSLFYRLVPTALLLSWAPCCKALWLLLWRCVACTVLLQPLLSLCWQHPGLPGWPPCPHDGGLHTSAVACVSAWHRALRVALRGEGRTPKGKRGEPGLWETRLLNFWWRGWGRMLGIFQEQVSKGIRAGRMQLLSPSCLSSLVYQKLCNELKRQHFKKLI